MIRGQSKSKSKIGPKPRKASKATQDKRTDSKMRNQAKNIAKQGRYGDSELVHMNPAEIQGIASLMGQQPTVNPKTGKPEMFLFALPLAAAAAAPLAAAAAPVAAGATGALMTAAAPTVAGGAMAGGTMAATAPTAMGSGLSGLVGGAASAAEGLGATLAGGAATAAEGAGSALASGAATAAEAAGSASAAGAAEAAGTAAASAPEAAGSALAGGPQFGAGSSIYEAGTMLPGAEYPGLTAPTGGGGFNMPPTTMTGMSPTTTPSLWGPSGVPEMGSSLPTTSAMQPGATSMPPGSGYLTAPMGDSQMATAMAKNPGFFQGVQGMNGGATLPSANISGMPGADQGIAGLIPQGGGGNLPPSLAAATEPAPVGMGSGSITAPGAPMGSNPILPPTSADMAAAGQAGPGGMGRIEGAFDAIANMPPSSGYGTMSLNPAGSMGGPPMPPMEAPPVGMESGIGPGPYTTGGGFGAEPTSAIQSGLGSINPASSLNPPPVPELPGMAPQAPSAAMEAMPPAGSFGGSPMPAGAEAATPTISNITPKPVADPMVPSSAPSAPPSAPSSAPAGNYPSPTPKPAIPSSYPMPSPKPEMPMGGNGPFPTSKPGMTPIADKMASGLGSYPTPTPKPSMPPVGEPMSVPPSAPASTPSAAGTSVSPPSPTVGSSTVPGVSTPASSSGIGSLFGGNTMQYALPGMMMANSLMGPSMTTQPPTDMGDNGKSKWWSKPHTGAATRNQPNFNDDPGSSKEHDYFPNRKRAGTGGSAKRKAGGGAVTKGPQGTTPGPGVKPPPYGGPPTDSGGDMGYGPTDNMWNVDPSMIAQGAAGSIFPKPAAGNPNPGNIGGAPGGVVGGGLASLGNATRFGGGGAVPKGVSGTTPGPGVKPPPYGGPPTDTGGDMSYGPADNLWNVDPSMIAQGAAGSIFPKPAPGNPNPGNMGGTPGGIVGGGILEGLASFGSANRLAEGGMFGAPPPDQFGERWKPVDPSGKNIFEQTPATFGGRTLSDGGNGYSGNPMAMGAPTKPMGPMSPGFMGKQQASFNQPAGRFAAGGQIQSPEKRLMAEAESALKGEHPNPQQVLGQYISVYGENSLMDLANSLAQKAPANNARMDPTQAHYLQGPGDGMSDSIPARGGQQDVILSDGEYIIPADVVSGLGNGSSGAGSRRLDQMVNNVRVDRTGKPAQPKQIDPGRYV